MVVAMIAMRVMKVAVDQIVDVVAVWHRRVAATRAMLMRMIVMNLVLVVSHGCLLCKSHSGTLACMRDGVLDQGQDVIVGDAVDDALALSSTSDQPGRMQDLQARR